MTLVLKGSSGCLRVKTLGGGGHSCPKQWQAGESESGEDGSVAGTLRWRYRDWVITYNAMCADANELYVSRQSWATCSEKTWAFLVRTCLLSPGKSLVCFPASVGGTCLWVVHGMLEKWNSMVPSHLEKQWGGSWRRLPETSFWVY